MKKISNKLGRPAKGGVESDSDKDINIHGENFDKLLPRYKELKKKITVLSKSNNVNIEASRSLSDDLRAIGHILKELKYGEKSVALAETFLQLGAFIRQIEDLRAKLDSALNSGLGVPVEKWIENLKNGQASVKEHNRIKSKHMTAIQNHQQLKEAKKQNQVKIQEAKKEEELTNDLWIQSGTQTTTQLTSMLDESFTRSLESITKIYLSNFNTFFITGLETVQGIVDDTSKIKEQGSANDKKVEKKEKVLDDLPPDEKLKELMNLFVKSEKKYVKKLDSILAMKHTLMYACDKDPKLAESFSVDERNIIFSNIEDIWAVHNQFSSALQKLQKKGKAGALSSLVVGMLDRWSVYMPYAANLTYAKECIDRNKSNRVFKAFLRDDLKELLTVPLDRFREYTQHLKALSQAGYSDDLGPALSGIKELTKDTIQAAKPTSDLGRLHYANSKIRCYSGTIVEPHRRFLRESPIAFLTTRTNEKTGEEEIIRNVYQCYLFNDIFVWCKEDESTGAMKFVKKLPTSLPHLKASDNGKETERVGYRFIGDIPLSRIEIEDLPDTEEIYNAVYLVVTQTSQSGTNVISLFGKDVDGNEFVKRKVKLMWPNNQEKKAWLNDIKDIMKNLKIMKVFGVDLNTLLTSNPKEIDRKIPRVMEVTTKYLTERGIKTQGIFRESGGAMYVEKLRLTIDMGGDLEFPLHETDHNVASLLKLWLRELPEPLLTWDLYENWVRAGQTVVQERDTVLEGEEMTDSIVNVKACVDELPNYNKWTVQILMKLLHKIAQPENVEFNLMESHNISIVFGPVLVRKKGASPFDTVDFRYIYAVVDVLINYYPKIFGDVEKELGNSQGRPEKGKSVKEKVKKRSQDLGLEEESAKGKKKKVKKKK